MKFTIGGVILILKIDEINGRPIKICTRVGKRRTLTERRSVERYHLTDITNCEET